MQTLPRSMWAILALLTLCWGLNWPMMKLALADLPVWTFRAACLVSGTIGLFTIARASGLTVRVPEGQWPRLMITAFFNIAVWNVLIGYGLTLLPAGRSAILAYTMPLWVVVLSIFVLNEKLTARRIAGVTLGMGGMLLLIGSELAVLRAAPVGALLVVGAAVSWAIGTVLMKRYPTQLPTTSFVAWQLALGGIPVIVGALILDWGKWQPIGTPATVGLLYNMFVAFIFCHWAWFKIATSAPAGVAALSTMMIPVVGVFTGMLVLGEQPRWPEYAALILVTLALATVLVPSRPVSR
ncbi:MAG TPA: DMT family transporter [Burkholderiales bacterium]|nr:DMT family transporter [Burkholderiales bacterium]